MKKHFFLTWLLVCSFTFLGLAQKKYTFESFPGDPLGTRIYTLNNGLKVYLTVYNESPRIQTAVAVRTGSKNDPSDNTGLSHYLEHMMFKGTKHFGTTSYEQEAPLLQRIEDLFEQYRRTSDSTRRKEIYKEIDLVSAQAASLAIANEYDKLVSVIGAKGTNAFTRNEQTVYINDIPSNQIENWLKIESDRFANPVFRLFHTELETVYEEKNMSLDRDGDKLWETLDASLFTKHPYGTQTTLGTVEHLKNPSIKRLRQYYNERYVANNMALIMAGDFNPDSAIVLIDKYFSVIKKKTVSPFESPEEDDIRQPVVREVKGPDAESVAIGFRTGGLHTKDANLLDLTSEVLSNGKAGLIDLNLKLAQKVLSANAGANIMADYSTLVLTGKPKENQSLEEVKDLLLAQVELVKKGEFPDWLLPAIITNRKLSRIRQMESNMSRAMILANLYTTNQPYEEYVNEIEILSKITKKDIVNFARKNFRDNYVLVYKRTGKDENVKKVVKPEITPVVMQRDKESSFFTELAARPVAEIKPVFLNYSTDMKKFRLKRSGLDVQYIHNKESNWFSLYYYFPMGSQNDLQLALAVNYLTYLGTSKMTAEQLKQEFYKLGCSYSVNVSNDEIYVNLTGLHENMVPAARLLEDLLADAQPDQKSLDNLVSDILKSRNDNKLNKNYIRQALSYYGSYGEKSSFTNILSEKELREISTAKLVERIHGLTSYTHEILYYGPAKYDDPIGVRPKPTKEPDIASFIDKFHRVPEIMKPVPPRIKYELLPTEGSKVLAVDYPMKQVDIMLYSRSVPFGDVDYPTVRMFNEYFGSGMNSIVFQEIREAKALAYSSSASYRNPSYANEFNSISGFVGTQNDKLKDALEAMFALFNNMPESEKNYLAARDALLNQIRSERITKTRIFFNYISNRKLGYSHDIRKDVYEAIPTMPFEKIKAFQQQYLKDKFFTIMVVGDTQKMNIQYLEKFGKVTHLKPEQIFGY